MRQIVLPVLLLAFAVVTAACSGGGSSSLTGKIWKLTAVTEVAPAFQGVVPSDAQSSYTIEFKTTGTFDAKADCNLASGQYTTTSTGGMTITPGPMTLAACPEGSLGPQFIDGLSEAASYVIANNQLTITTKGGDTLVFG